MSTLFNGSGYVRFFLIVCYTIVGGPVIKKDMIPLSGLTPPYCLPFPSQDLDFQRHMSWVVFCFCVQRVTRWLFVLL